MLQPVEILHKHFHRHTPKDGIFDRSECHQQRQICVVPMGMSPGSIWPERFQSAELIVLYGSDTSRKSDPDDYLRAHVAFARAHLHPYLDEDDLRNAGFRPPIEILPHPFWNGSDTYFTDSQDPRLKIRVSCIRPNAVFNLRVFSVETPQQALDFVSTRMKLPSLDCQN